MTSHEWKATRNNVAVMILTMTMNTQGITTWRICQNVAIRLTHSTTSTARRCQPRRRVLEHWEVVQHHDIAQKTVNLTERGKVPA
jgi:hypothetical protein